MKTSFKKSNILSIILCLVLIISSLPVMSVAAKNSDLVSEEGFKYIIADNEVELVKYVGDNKNVVIPSEIEGFPVTKLNGTFQFSSIESVVIPGSVKTLELFEFRYCSKLTSVVIENGVEQIDDYAFKACENLTSITIPESVINIGSQAFYGTAYYNDESNWNDDALYIGTALIKVNVKSAENYLIKPGTTVIATDAFKNVNLEGAINMPDSIRGISDSAFYRASINSIKFSSNLTHIGKNAFELCYSLKSITLPQSLKSIGSGAFYECNYLTSVTIPKNVSYIGMAPFRDCDNLTEINVETANQYYASVNGVLYNKDITNLIQYPTGKKDTTFIIPDTVTSIESWSFAYCANTVSVTIPDSVTIIGTYFLYGCDNLVSVDISSKLEAIPDGMLRDCHKLAYVNIPASVKTIDEGALKTCYNLEKIDVDTENKNFVSVDGVLFNKNMTKLIVYPACKKDTEYTVPDTVTSTDSYAFAWCKNLCYVTFSSGLPIIEDGTFYGCVNLINVNIPDTVTNIYNYAFAGCQNLTYINIPASVTEIEFDAFNACENLWHVLYEGKSVGQWNSIVIDSGNDNLINATRHYSASNNLVGYNVTKVPDCTEGTAYYGCYICNEQKEKVLLPTDNHILGDDACTVCKKTVKHPYDNKTDETWTVYRENAKNLTITFSKDTKTEENYDFIYLYDKDNNEIGKYTGSKLANKTITVNGDTCNIRLVSDDNNCYYGFRVMSVEAEYEGIELGDVNGDGEVTIADVTDVQFAISKQLTFNDTQIKAADTDKDGSITVNDVTTLQFYLAKIITEF